MGFHLTFRNPPLLNTLSLQKKKRGAEQVLSASARIGGTIERSVLESILEPSEPDQLVAFFWCYDEEKQAWIPNYPGLEITLPLEAGGLMAQSEGIQALCAVNQIRFTPTYGPLFPETLLSCKLHFFAPSEDWLQLMANGLKHEFPVEIKETHLPLDFEPATDSIPEELQPVS